MADTRARFYPDVVRLMRLFVVNPNSTAEMTARIADETRSHLPPGINLIVATNTSGPPAIQGAEDGVAALSGTLALMRSTAFDAAIIGCFDDTGLQEIRNFCSKTVIGLGEAAFVQANRLGQRFAVLTTSILSVPVLIANIENYGLHRNCCAIKASCVDVLDFEHDRPNATRRLIAAGHELLARHPGIASVVLGCAGMGGLDALVSNELGVPVIDPIRAAVELAMERMNA